jgi:hypothetical protein
MKRSDQDRLLRELLADEQLAATRETSLAEGLAALHHRRQRRVMVSRVAVSVALIAIMATISLRRTTHDPVAPAAPMKISSVKVINDEQLLALFPDRSVALIGAPGAQELVFLDQPKEQSNERKNR